MDNTGNKKKKLFLKPPMLTRSMLITQIIIGLLFWLFGIVFVVVSEGEAKLISVFFFLVWSAGCLGIVVHCFKLLKLLKNGKIEIAEIGDMSDEGVNGPESKLRSLEALKRDGLITEAEYQKKREEIMEEKW